MNTLSWLLSPSTYTWPECAALEKDGWRIPTLKEQESIVDFSRINPCVDPALFAGLPLDQYWTATDDATNPGQMRWCVDFMTGSAVKVQASDPNEKHHVMLVQGTMQQSVFVGLGDTVVDPVHSVMWKRDFERRVPIDPEPGQEDRRNCFTVAQGQERAAADRTGGFSDWRMPTIREVRSLIDESHLRPRGDGYSCAMNEAFPPTPYQAWFWSCTPQVDFFQNQNKVWAVQFDVGVSVGDPNYYMQYVRLVRDCAATPVDGYTEAEVRGWFAAVEKTPQPAGLAYWMNPAHGGPKVFYSTVKLMTESARDSAVAGFNRVIETCERLISQ